MTDSNNASDQTPSEDEQASSEQSAPLESEDPPLLDPESLNLPEDASTPEFTEQLQELRTQFEDRTSYNFMVCDELARRGVQPNSASVLKVGKWGASTAVASDVRSWYANLSRRLQASHANIPDAARTKANHLFEQLWGLALSLSTVPYQERIAELQGVVQSTEAQRAQLVQVRDRLRGDVDRLGEHLAVAQQRGEDTERKRATEQASHETALHTLQTAMDQAAWRHTSEKEQMQKEFDSERRTAAERLEEAQRRAAAAAATYEQELRSARAEQDALRTRIDAIHRESSLQIDAARQDMREANGRAQQAEQTAATHRNEILVLRDKLAEALIASAQKDAKQAELNAQIDRLKTDLAAAALERETLDVARAKHSDVG